MARGKLVNKRCKNGTRRNKKTKKCEKKLNPKAKTFSMKKMGLNPKAKSFSFKKGVKMVESLPRKAVGTVVKGVKGMDTLTKRAIRDMPRMKSGKKSKKKTGKRPPNPWMVHLAAYRKAHPGMKLKSAMQGAKKSYKKV